MSDTKRLHVPFELKADGPEGRLIAAIVKFDAIDSDQDVILKSAWEPGQLLPIVPSHDWKSYAIGEGVTGHADGWGTVEGELFTDTTAGMDWYRSMKRRKSPQQWSFGFEITDAEKGTKDGKNVQFIKGLRLIEASPVLLGAQSESHLIGIKAAALGSYEQRMERLSTALRLMFTDGYGDGYAYIVATFDTYLIAMVYTGMESEFFRVEYSIDANGMPTLGSSQRVDQTYVPDMAKGLSYLVHTEHVLASMQEWKTRTRSLADLRAKEGRRLGENTRTRIIAVRDAMAALEAARADLDALIAETERVTSDESGKAAGEGLRLFIEHQRTIARQLGVAV